MKISFAGLLSSLGRVLLGMLGAVPTVTWARKFDNSFAFAGKN